VSSFVKCTTTGCTSFGFFTVANRSVGVGKWGASEGAPASFRSADSVHPPLSDPARYRAGVSPPLARAQRLREDGATQPDDDGVACLREADDGLRNVREPVALAKVARHETADGVGRRGGVAQVAQHLHRQVSSWLTSSSRAWS